MIPHSPNVQRGMSLIELMVAMAVGLLISGVAISLLTTNLTASSTSLRYTRINQDLRGTMNAMVHDVTRAGNWGLAEPIVDASLRADLVFSARSGDVTVTTYRPGAAETPGNLVNVFAAPFTTENLEKQTLMMLVPDSTLPGRPIRGWTVQINSITDPSRLSVTIPAGVTLPARRIRGGSWSILNPFNGIATDGVNTCLRMSYDLDGDGVQDPDERYSYRLNAARGTIDTNTDGDPCAGGDGWEAITDENAIRITGFRVTEVAPVLTAPNTLQALVKEYQIELDGQLRSDADATRSLRQVVKVRNNEFFPPAP